MSIHYNKQSQFELFPGAVGPSTDTKRAGFFRTTLTFSLDNLVVIAIVFLMFLVVAYSLGIERGKFVVRLKERPVHFKTVSALIAPKPLTITRVVARPAPRASPPEAMGLRPVVPPSKVVIQPTSVKGMPQSVAHPRLLPKAENTIPSEKPTTGSDTLPEKKVDNNYTVQVASYANAQDAQQAVTDLKRRGIEATFMPKGKYTILCIGQFSEKPEAEKASRKLKRQFKDCLIRSL